MESSMLSVRSRRSGNFAIVLCLTGALRCAGVDFTPGDFFLVPASLRERTIHPRGEAHRFCG